MALDECAGGRMELLLGSGIWLVGALLEAGAAVGSGYAEHRGPRIDCTEFASSADEIREKPNCIPVPE